MGGFFVYTAVLLKKTKREIMMTLNEKINLRGNREQHHAVSCLNRLVKNPKVLRRGVWVINSHITNKTGKTFNFYPFW